MDTPATFLAADKYLRMALEEDITSEDVTTAAIMRQARPAQAELICKQDGILAGLPYFQRIFQLLDPQARVDALVSEGAQVRSGQLLAVVRGDVRALLSGERTALNYLQRLSGIATLTRTLVTQLEGTGTVLLDTRKTTPCMRLFEKYAVRIGGGQNHRYNLSDGVLIKDNHISAAGGIRQAVEAARAYAPFVRKIEVEAETPDMVRQALEAGADIIMLDNMTLQQMQESLQIIGGRAATECSGNVTAGNIREIAALGVDYISCGALTHSAPILDLSLKHLQLCGCDSSEN